ncbi:MAG: aminotransferase class I/II-fold pyridoxal phosphate-dependent enzyme [Saprospiraceae bacterium]|nr:aminotransferase class I/II-fold pyridoxal phosphate-dependent enzyme [Saprospiraceae bacterium]
MKSVDIIPYGRQHITDADIAAVVEVLRSDYLTQGPKIAEFEQAFAAYVGSKYAVAVSNGTAALHLCTLALGVQPGHKVITTPITFAASANCVRYCGGEVIFADIDPDTYLLDIREVRKLLESAPKGTYQGIIPVDFAGRPIDMEAFRNLADEFGCWIIEDACHAPGGSFTDSKGHTQRCGNGNYADLAIFSFHPVKHIATGEGGMITTNNPELYAKLLTLRTHGITKYSGDFQNLDMAVGNWPLAIEKESQQSTVNGQQPMANSQKTANSQWPMWYMEMQTLGYNYRLTDFQAALGLSQLQRAEEGLQKRQEIAAVYYNAFKNIPGILDKNIEAGDMAVGNWPLAIDKESQELTANSQQPENSQQPKKGQQPTANSQQPTTHAYHLYVIEVENRLELYNHLRAHNIYAQIHYIPTHLMPYYRQLGWKPGDMLVAEAYYERCISLPMYPTLREEELAHVITTVLERYA